MLSYKPHFTWFTPVWVWRKREEVFQSLPLPSVVKDLQTQNLRVLWHGTNNTLQKEFQSPWPKVANFLHSLQVSWRWTLAKGSAETNERKSNLEQAALSDAALIAKVVTAGLSNYVLKNLIRKWDQTRWHSIGHCPRTFTFQSEEDIPAGQWNSVLGSSLFFVRKSFIRSSCTGISSPCLKNSELIITKGTWKSSYYET